MQCVEINPSTKAITSNDGFYAANLEFEYNF